MNNYNEYTRNQLIEECRKLSITGYSSKTKSKLIELINNKLMNEIDEKFNNISLHNDRPLSPLIKWSGGKSDEIKHFLQYIPTNYDTYIEPFFGGGALYWYLRPNKSVINDVHPELIAFYNSIKNGKSTDIINFMNNHPNDEETYYQVRDDFIPSNDLEIAQQFYYLRKTCFRGMLRYNSSGKFNIPYGKYKTINITQLSNNDYYNVLQNTEIYNQSYNYIFDKYNDPNNFIFLDPPYDSKFTDYGYCTFDRVEQEKLAQLFKTTSNRCLMIIGKTDFIVNLYKDYIKGSYQKKYKFKIHSGRIGDEINTEHLIITNY
jgi:DNA adenine methylase